jgi:hypothetical protein
MDSKGGRQSFPVDDMQGKKFKAKEVPRSNN